LHQLFSTSAICGQLPTGPISFRLHAGEILGLAGVEDIFHGIFGVEELTSGELIYDAQRQDVRSPVDAVRLGWGFIPASRREQGLMMSWSIRRNTTLLILDRLINRLGLIDELPDRRTAGRYVQRLSIATKSVDERVIQLSGGNHQKVVLARWLASHPKVMILNDPTRGIDVGAKLEVYQICDQLAQQGLAILFASSEVDETLGLCDRILVVHKGQIVRELRRGRTTKTEIIQWMSGGIDGIHLERELSVSFQGSSDPSRHIRRAIQWFMRSAQIADEAGVLNSENCCQL
jgi:ABC-type sugar transport system ATPase subunit